MPHGPECRCDVCTGDYPCWSNPAPIAVPMVPVPPKRTVAQDLIDGLQAFSDGESPYRVTTLVGTPPGKVLVDAAFVAKVRDFCKRLRDWDDYKLSPRSSEMLRDLADLLPAE